MTDHQRETIEEVEGHVRPKTADAETAEGDTEDTAGRTKKPKS